MSADIKYEYVTIEECESINNSCIACICDGDRKEVKFRKEKIDERN